MMYLFLFSPKYTIKIKKHNGQGNNSSFETNLLADSLIL